MYLWYHLKIQSVIRQADYNYVLRSPDSLDSSQLIYSTFAGVFINWHVLTVEFVRVAGCCNVYLPIRQVYITASCHSDKLYSEYVPDDEGTCEFRIYQLRGVRRIWGPEYIIVTADGLPIESSSGTKGTLQTPIILLSVIIPCPG